MNAREIADRLSSYYIEGDNSGLFNRRIRAMLIEQADRILELEFNIRMNEMKYLERIEELEKEAESLKDEVAKWRMSYENNERFWSGCGHN